jgi:hypothetical protein
LDGNVKDEMPRETKLPNLGKAPDGYTWSLRRVQNKVNGKFGTQGFSYFISVMKGKTEIIDTRFFIPKSDEAKTNRIVKEAADRIRKIINP